MPPDHVCYINGDIEVGRCPQCGRNKTEIYQWLESDP